VNKVHDIDHLMMIDKASGRVAARHGASSAASSGLGRSRYSIRGAALTYNAQLHACVTGRGEVQLEDAPAPRRPKADRPASVNGVGESAKAQP
jgi:hypothetical protein